jgi:hypothetical protein
MCFPWIDNPECVLFEHSLRSLTDLVEFVDDASRWIRAPKSTS